MIHYPLNAPYLQDGKKQTDNRSEDLNDDIMKKMKRPLIELKRSVSKLLKNVK